MSRLSSLIDKVIPFGTWMKLTPEQRAQLQMNADFIMDNYPTVKLLIVSPDTGRIYLEAKHNGIYKGMTTIIAISAQGFVDMSTMREMCADEG